MLPRLNIAGGRIVCLAFPGKACLNFPKSLNDPNTLEADLRAGRGSEDQVSCISEFIRVLATHAVALQYNAASDSVSFRGSK